MCVCLFTGIYVLLCYRSYNRLQVYFLMFIDSSDAATSPFFFAAQLNKPIRKHECSLFWCRWEVQIMKPLPMYGDTHPSSLPNYYKISNPSPFSAFLSHVFTSLRITCFFLKVSGVWHHQSWDYNKMLNRDPSYHCKVAKIHQFLFLIVLVTYFVTCFTQNIFL